MQKERKIDQQKLLDKNKLPKNPMKNSKKNVPGYDEKLPGQDYPVRKKNNKS